MSYYRVEPPKELMQAKRHFTEALVDGRVLFKLGDDGYVQVPFCLLLSCFYV